MPSGKLSFQEVKSVRCFGLPLIWVAVVLIVGVVVAILLTYALGAFSPDTETAMEEEEEEIGKFRIVGREEWKAQKPLHRPEPLLHPIQFLIIMHTGHRNCTSLKDCSELLREIQQYHMKNATLWDIAPNFLIGGDGKAYEGRGWDFSGVFVTRFNIKAFGISFIGNFDNDLPTPLQMTAYKNLLEEGINLDKLTEYNRVMAQSQFVRVTRSPGNAFYEHIKTWDNWMKEP